MVTRFFAISDSGGTISTFLRRMLLTGSHSGALTDYQSLHTITYESEMQADFDDIRFVTDSGVHVPYWIESKTDSTTADVWIQSGIIDGSTPIWMYYGNADLSSGSSGSDVFIQWHGAASSAYVDTLTSNLVGAIIIEGKVRATASSHNLNWGIAETSANGGGDRFTVKSYSIGADIYGYSTNDGTESIVGRFDEGGFVLNQWNDIKISYDGTTARFYFDDTELEDGNTSNIPDENMGLQYYAQTGTGEQEYLYARQYAATEPTWSYSSPQHARTNKMIL